MDLAILDATSEKYLGQWKRLVSTTNWDKGRIIHEWRGALVAAEAEPAEYSDETWSRQAGNVTPQHVGRLRRVFERFGAVREEYDGLYWSHFQAAVDWTDAEMWLEGAVHSGWSIAQMRLQRSETLGEVAHLELDQQVAETPWDDDAEPAENSERVAAESHAGKIDTVRPAQKNQASDDSDESSAGWTKEESSGDDRYDEAERPRAEPIRPFANLALLPADVSEAFEAFKLCILKHKLAGWAELSRDELVGSLEALKELALAPAET